MNVSIVAIQIIGTILLIYNVYKIINKSFQKKDVIFLLISILVIVVAILTLIPVNEVMDAGSSAEKIDSILDYEYPSGLHLVFVKSPYVHNLLDKFMYSILYWNNNPQFEKREDTIYDIWSEEDNTIIGHQYVNEMKDNIYLAGYGYISGETIIYEESFVIARVYENAPEEYQKLHNGDLILAYDGISMNSLDSLHQYIKENKLHEIEIEYEQNGLIQSSVFPVSYEYGRYGLSIWIGSEKDFKLPEEYDMIEFKDDLSFGGSSGGLVTTLQMICILDQLDCSSKVAATGTISPDGSVGGIGALYQKVGTVYAGKFPYFLVPDSQYDEAMEAVKDQKIEGLEIIGVSHIQEAIDVLLDLNDRNG